MKNILYIILLFALSSCYEPDHSLFGIIFFNTSEDTVNVRVYGHRIGDEDTIVRDMLGNGDPACPHDSLGFYWVGDVNETGTTWESFFVYKKIDNLYVKVTKELELVHKNEKYKTPSEDNSLKFYKYTWDDVKNVDTEIITIIYP